MIRNNLPGAVLDPAHPLSMGLVGWWLMNDGAGERVADISTKGNHGIFGNIVPSTTSGWQGGIFGRSIRFDGSNDKITVKNNASLVTPGEFTISAWVKATNYTAWDMYIAKGILAIPNNKHAPFGMFTEGGTLYWAFQTGNGVNSNTYLTTAIFGARVLDRWYHVVGIHTGGTAAGTTDLLYQNGQLADKKTTSYTVADNNSDLLFGTNIANDSPFGGNLSNVRYWNRALSADEVRMLYTQPLAGLITQPSRPARHFIFSAAAPAGPPHPITSDRLHNRGGNWGRIWRRGETT